LGGKFKVIIVLLNVSNYMKYNGVQLIAEKEKKKKKKKSRNPKEEPYSSPVISRGFSGNIYNQ